RVRRPPISPLFPYTTLFRSFQGLSRQTERWRPVFDELRGAIGTEESGGRARRLYPAEYRVDRLCSGVSDGNQRVCGVRTAHRAKDRKSTRLNSSHRTISYAV